MPPSSPALPDLPRCDYCGAALNRALYFCPRCGTPHCDPEDVLGSPEPLPQSDGERIRAQAPKVWPLFWTVAAVLLTGVILRHTVAPGADDEAVLARLVSFALMAVSAVWGVQNWRALLVQLRRPGFLRWEGWAALGGLLVLLPLNVGMRHVFYGLAPELEQAMLKYYGSFSSTELLVYFCIVPAIVEEILFRGLIQHWLQVAVSPRKAILYASALFAAIHLSAATVPYLLLVGLLLGWAKWRTGSLYPSMVVHFLHNYLVLKSLM